MKKLTFTLLTLACAIVLNAQSSKSGNTSKWITVSEDEGVKISYNSQKTTDKRGNHIVWVKAEYYAEDWQWYFANMIGSSVPVTTTKTKALYDAEYNYCMVRQVMCYSKSGKLLYNSGDSNSGGWGPVNASDPVGIVGEYLEKKEIRDNYEW